MDISEDNVQMLRDMGFPCESEVRRALRMAKNDLNEAVAILANDHPSSSYDTLDDVEMKDVHRRSTHTQVYGPHLPPAYDEVVESQVSSSIIGSSGVASRPTLDRWNQTGLIYLTPK